MSGDTHASALAAASLRKLLDDPEIPDAVRRAMVPEFAELARALAKLENDELHIAAFGRVSVGKSALLNALLGRDEFTVGVLHGTTQNAEQEAWRSSSGGGIHVIDTPGIDELGGEARERIALTAAQRVDLILFVVEGDITDTELAALRLLHRPERPMLLVLNKVDRYTQADRARLLEKLAERTQGIVSAENTVAASARPARRIVIRIDADGREQESQEQQAPEMAALKARIAAVLDQEGRTISALNAGLMASQMSDQLGKRLIEVRKEVANTLVHTYSLTKGVAVGLNPIPVADLVAAAGLDVALVVHLSRVYSLPLTKTEAGQLIGSICAQLAVLMGAIWGVHLVASALKGLSVGLSTALTAGAQGALAYYATMLTGKAAEKYLENGKSWGALGPKRVVEEILAGLDRDSVLRQAKAEIAAKLRA
jgi:GTPase